MAARNGSSRQRLATADAVAVEAASQLAPDGSRDAVLIDSASWHVLQSELGLSRREIEVAQHIFACDKLATTARQMRLALGTVKTYTQRLYSKLHVDDQRSLLLAIVRAHLRLQRDRSAPTQAGNSSPV